MAAQLDKAEYERIAGFLAGEFGCLGMADKAVQMRALLHGADADPLFEQLISKHVLSFEEVRAAGRCRLRCAAACGERHAHRPQARVHAPRPRRVAAARSGRPRASPRF